MTRQPTLHSFAVNVFFLAKESMILSLFNDYEEWLEG